MTFFGMTLSWAFECSIMYLVYHFVLTPTQGVYFFVAVTVGLIAYFIHFFVDLTGYLHFRARDAYLERKFSVQDGNIATSVV
ncbi:MAG: hypothetical protein AAB551_03475 [Patescibacteria group bacterium]